MKAAQVQRVALVLTDGTVRLASDKKIEGKPAASVFPGATLAADTPTIQAVADRGLRAVIPIMGLNARLGTLIVDYAPPRPETNDGGRD